MNVTEFLKTSWEEHANQPQKVADSLKSASRLIDTSDQIPLMAQLIVHVFGEHLGKWDEGIDASNLTHGCTHFSQS